jgi:hypothetical protein
MSQPFSAPILRATPVGTADQETPVAKVRAAHVVGVSVVVLFVIASAAWLAWRVVSLELSAVYAEAFREARLSEE